MAITKQLKANLEVETEIISVLRSFSDLVSKKEKLAVLSLFAPDSDVVSIGSEARETAVGQEEIKAFLERVLSRPYSFSWKWDWTLVSAKDQFAWVSAKGSVIKSEGETRLFSPYRLTAVFEKRGERWLLVQYHGSEPV